MNIKTPLLAAMLFGAPALSNAFTIDASSLGVSELSTTPLTLNVPGYGSLVFQAAPGSTLTIDSRFMNDNGAGAPSINFENGEMLKITFNGEMPSQVDFDFVGVSAGESFTVQRDLFSPQAFDVSLQSAGNGAGIFSFSFNAVPEPTSAILGAFGMAMLTIRRRR